MTDQKKKYHHGNLREALKAAALDLLDKAGLEAVTIRAVARAAQVAHSAPANHFPTRSALLTEIAVDIFSQLGDGIAAALESCRGGKEVKLQTIASQVISFGLENPHRYRLLWRQDLLDDDPRLEAAMDRIYDRLMAVLSDENNSMNVGVESQAIALWSLVHGYVSLRLDESLVAKEDEQSGQPRAEAIINVMIEGIGR